MTSDDPRPPEPERRSPYGPRADTGAAASTAGSGTWGAASTAPDDAGSLPDVATPGATEQDPAQAPEVELPGYQPPPLPTGIGVVPEPTGWTPARPGPTTPNPTTPGPALPGPAGRGPTTPGFGAATPTAPGFAPPGAPRPGGPAPLQAPAPGAEPGFGLAPTASVTPPGALAPVPAAQAPSGYSGPAYPGQAYPGQSSPGPAYPGQSYPGQSYPGQAYPGQSYPGQSNPQQGLPLPGHPAPGYGWAPVQPYDGLAIASISVSGAALVLSWLFALVLVAAPVGLALGIWSLARIRRTSAQGKGLAITGVVLGGVGTLFLVLGALAFGLFLWAFSTGW